MKKAGKKVDFCHNILTRILISFKEGYMKKLTVALALATTTGAFAQDLRLGDLNFFQKQGSIFWQTSLDYSTVDSEEKSAGDKYEYERTRTSFDNTVTYGVSDRFNVGLGLNYAFINDVENSKVPAGNTKGKDAEMDGLSDVSIVGNYRLLNKDLFVDLVAGLTVSLGDAEIAFNDDAKVTEGNNYQGHHSLRLGVAAGQKLQNNMEWRAFLGADHHFSGDAELKSGSNKFDADTDSFTNWLASVDGQYRMNNWAFNLGLDYVVTGDQTREFKESGTKVKQDLETDNHFRIRLAAKYNYSDNMLVSIGYQATTSHDVEVKETPNSKATEEFDMAHRFVLGAQFLF